MSDLVERLHDRASTEPNAINVILFNQAADEIERLGKGWSEANSELMAERINAVGLRDEIERLQALAAHLQARFDKLEAERDALLALLAEALAAWEGTGPAIELDRIRAALGKEGNNEA